MGHDALADLPADGTGGVAFFAYLADFKQNVFTYHQPGAHWKLTQVHTLHGDILGKVPGLQLQTQTAHFVDAGYSEQAHLAVGQDAGVSIADQSMPLGKLAFGDGLLLDPFFLAGADGNYSSYCSYTPLF